MSRRLYQTIAMLLFLLLPVNTESAFATSKEAIELNNAGVKALNQGDYQLAISKFKEALRLDPKYSLPRDNIAIAHNNLGLTLRSSPRSALKEFHHALFLQPGNRATSTNVAAIIKLMGMDPTSLYDRLELAESALAENDLESAIVEYRAAIQIEDNPYIRQKLAKAYKALGYSLQAEAQDHIAQTAIKLIHDQEANIADDGKQTVRVRTNHDPDSNPFDVDAHIKAGKEFQQIGRLDDAEKEYRLAIRFCGDKLSSKMEAEKLLAALIEIRRLKDRKNDAPDSAQRAYLDTVKERLETSWKTSQKRELEITRVNVSIDSTGKIMNTRVTTASGDLDEDATVLQALKSVNLPPLPAQIKQLELDLTFASDENSNVVNPTFIAAHPAKLKPNLAH